ncbi:MAG: hypothetical protein GY856_03290 [bacterium]|nr:hypothetical protein [bacterium]
MTTTPNDSRRPDPRRQACDELAELLSGGDGLRTARLLQLTEVLAPAVPGPRTPDQAGEAPAAAAEGPRPISIWQPRQEDGELVFVRPEPLPLGDHHAVRRALPAGKPESTVRICLFGESVAAGYLYAPHLTPARVLEEQLRSVGGEVGYEVIDLARTNERLGPLAATVRSAMQLAPDLLVIFVGNNWNLLETPEVSPYIPSVGARQRYGLALRHGGLGAAIDLARRQLHRAAEAAFDTVAEIARGTRIPVIVLVPEVNLADWENRQPVPWLPGDGTARWHALYEEALAALRAKRYAAAIEAAEAMRALDRGLCGTADRLLAKVRIAQGRLEEARRACQAEVDHSHYATLGFLGAPQATTAAQEILRRGAAEHGFACVDLPRIFAEHSGSPLPGRRLFLDYCHLTREGIRVAMAAVASEVLRLTGDGEAEVSWSSLLADLPDTEIPPEADAVAKLGAAIHSAHRLVAVGEKGSIIEYWCRQALAASPGMAAAMLDLIAARVAPCPAVLTAAQGRNLASPYRLQLQHGWRWDYLDVDVIAAIRRTLERESPQQAGAMREAVDRLLLEHHPRRPGRCDLTQPPWLWDPLERLYPEVMELEDFTRRATCRAPWPASGFCLLDDAATDVDLELTARLPAVAGSPGGGQMRGSPGGGQMGGSPGGGQMGGSPGGGQMGGSSVKREGEVTVEVNGTTVDRFTAGEAWSRRSIRVPRQALRRGINRVVVRWPPPPPVGEAALNEAGRRLEQGVEADIHPIFGEVFSLWASWGTE